MEILNKGFSRKSLNHCTILRQSQLDWWKVFGPKIPIRRIPCGAEYLGSNIPAVHSHWLGKAQEKCGLGIDTIVDTSFLQQVLSEIGATDFHNHQNSYLKIIQQKIFLPVCLPASPTQFKEYYLIAKWKETVKFRKLAVLFTLRFDQQI